MIHFNTLLPSLSFSQADLTHLGPRSQARAAQGRGRWSELTALTTQPAWGLCNGPFPGWECIPRAECTAQPACEHGRARHLPARSQQPGVAGQSTPRNGLGMKEDSLLFTLKLDFN